MFAKMNNIVLCAVRRKMLTAAFGHRALEAISLQHLHCSKQSVRSSSPPRARCTSLSTSSTSATHGDHERPRVGVAVTILDDSLKCVVLVRRGKEPNKGLWSLCGGSVELGETVAHAAAREVLEETGLSVRLPVDPAFTVTDAIFDAEGERTDDLGAGARGTGVAARAAAGQDAAAGAGGGDDAAGAGDKQRGPGRVVRVHYHYTLAHLVAFAERCAVPVAADDADEAAWFDIAELQDLEEAKLLAGPVSQCVSKGVRSFEAGLLGALAPC